MNLPGVCIDCRAPVIWNGRFWKNPGRGMGKRHRCVAGLFSEMARNDPEFREWVQAEQRGRVA